MNNTTPTPNPFPRYSDDWWLWQSEHRPDAASRDYDRFDDRDDPDDTE